MGDQSMNNRHEEKAQQNFARRFSSHVDAILERADRAEDELSPEYFAAIDLAQELASLDFSQLGQKSELRRRLLTRPPKTNAAPIARRSVLSWRVGLAIALFALFLLGIFSPAGSSTVEAVNRFIKRLVYQNTIVLQIEPEGQPPPDVTREFMDEKLESGQAWEFNYEGTHFGGCCGDAARNESVTLAKALEQVNYTIVLPSHLDQNFSLQEVRLLGYEPYDVFVAYSGPAGRFGLYQTKVGVQSIQNIGENQAFVQSKVSGVVTEGTLEEVQIGSITGALVDGQQLVWEKDGLSLMLLSPDLDRETMVQIAESLSPAN